MAEPEHPVFPYTDDFRKAKRNSLIWSGITVAAALGSPPVVGGEATLSQLGLSLTYDKSVLVGISGTAAIFMALGFYQAYKRITLHASQLFAGKSDVDLIFSQLSKRASDAIRQIDDVVATYREQMRKDSDGSLFGMQEALTQVLKLQREEITLDRKIHPHTNEWARISDQDLIKAGPTIRAIFSQRFDRIRSIEDIANPALKNLGQFITKVGAAMVQAGAEAKQAVDKPVHDLASTVNTLTRFHDGIYRSEKIWFWAYDVAPVVALFGLAMIPFCRILLG